MSRHFASSAASQRPEASARRAFALSFPRMRGLASGLASIMSHLRRREEQRLSAQDQAIKSLALLQARKAILAHRKEELLSELAGAKAHPRKDRPVSLIRAELRAVTTEILSIG